MKIYSGKYLTIHYNKEKDRFIQFWSTPPESKESFKQEMLVYTLFYSKYKPSQTLWIQNNFSIILDENIINWIEKNVNIPCFQYGNKKTAFVVGKDALSHLTVIESFDKIKSTIKPYHFATKEEAEDWLNTSQKTIKEKNNTQITFEGVDKDGNSIITIRRSSKHIKNTIKAFKSLIDENTFADNNYDKYSLLTRREKEILSLRAEGMTYRAISEQLFLSLYTVNTHFRNIKRKLKIKSFNDIILYTKAFDI
ncbi:helix-turn-helix transcriptional regulator [uncultured Tenacibaculum sp.]|uniref:response regulator transcription factor n=1 Tax=uncultured Tenacibaculum sp. TaxID=174713 RepID=UPI002617AFD8|nr:helix-turn-helix transcriptional regulator [uncultured Tenacibaculum sp.]